MKQRDSDFLRWADEANDYLDAGAQSVENLERLFRAADKLMKNESFQRLCQEIKRLFLEALDRLMSVLGRLGRKVGELIESMDAQSPPGLFGKKDDLLHNATLCSMLAIQA